MTPVKKTDSASMNIWSFSLVLFLSTAIILFILKIWQADLSIPFQYDNDSIQYGEFIKSMIDNGWLTANRFVGMPSGRELYDFPQTENLYFIIQKLISLITGDFGATINIFYILTFPLTALVAFYVLRKFNIPALLSILGALLYAFMPYHFIRGIVHLNLSAYVLVPLSVLLALRVLSGEFAAPGGVLIDTGRPQNSRNGLFTGILICLLISSTGLYYVYFTCLLLFLAGLAGAYWRRTIAPAVTAAMLIAVIAAGFVMNIAPSVIYHARHGGNPAATTRVYHETELYALKMTSLLLPAADHRIRLFSDLKKQYNRESSYLYRFTAEFEQESSSLGLLGATGFMFLILALVFLRHDDFRDGRFGEGFRLLYHASVLNVFAVLTATVCGFSSFIAFVIRYKIRAYNRISIFIAFFSILALMIVLNYLYERFLKDRISANIAIGKFTLPVSSAVLGAVVAVLAIAGLYDQAGTGSVPNYRAIAGQFRSDRLFIEKIEEMTPKGAMIFQLPYSVYPGVLPPPARMSSYEHFKCYLHSKHLRWSFGAIVGRDADTWQKRVSALPARALLKEIAGKGFAGVIICKKGYDDNGDAMIREIQRELGTPPLSQEGGDLVFFSMLNNHRL